MQYYVGQKVSLLHESGEGKIIAILDRHHVEVDFGDDFPIDVHVDEIIPVKAEEEHYFQRDEEERADEPAAPQRLGGNLFDLSLAITLEGQTSYRLSLINPESSDALYTFFIKAKGKYSALAYGKASAGGKDSLAVLSREELEKIRSMYFQVLFYKTGTGHPQAPLVGNMSWSKEKLDQRAKPILPLGKEGWLFSLRKKEKLEDGELTDNFLKFKQQEPKVSQALVVDLHIEELVSRPHELSSGEMMEIQLEHFEKSLSDALVQHAEKLVLIHGVGVGTLKSEIRKRLKEHDRVRTFLPADPGKYGNGATEVTLR